MKNLFKRTPLVKSRFKTSTHGQKIWYKLEAFQPGGSFKIRGIGKLCQTHAENGAKGFICSSGGNAGLAASYSAKVLGLPIIVVIPKTASKRAEEKLVELGAKVIRYGLAWNDSHSKAQEILKDFPEFAFVHPFNDPLIWEKHSSLVDEIIEDGVRPQ